MTVEEGMDFFRNHPAILKKLETLMDVGLGYAYEVRTWTDDRTCVVKRYDLQDAQIAMGDGYAAVQYQYNENQYVIRMNYLDDHYNRTYISAGYSSVMRTVDKNGNTLTETYLDLDDNPVENSSGYGA